jgi:ribose transport system substrate-binding protein
LPVLMMALLWAGASNQGYAEGKRIGVVLLTQEHQFFKELVEGLGSEAKRYNFRISLDYSEFDATRQAVQVEELIAKRVDALILAPCNSITIGDSIVKANKAGIPVFTVDIANLSGKGEVVAHVSSDNREGGRLAGKLMVEALKGKGKVVIINHPKITSVMDRITGFKEYLRDYPGIQIIADIPAWGQRSRAMAIMEDLLLMMPDLNGVFAINDDSALGAVKAIESAGLNGKVNVVGYDGTPEARQAIDSGKIFGDVIQYPKDIGQLTIQAVNEYFSGKTVTPFIPVKVGVYKRK